MIQDRDMRIMFQPQDGAPSWMRVTLDTRNNTITQYAPSQDGITWQPLYTTRLRVEARWRKWLRPRYWLRRFRTTIAAARGDGEA